MATWGTTLIVGVVRACVADGNEALEGPESSSLGDEIYENRVNLITSYVCVCVWMHMCVHMTVCILCVCVHVCVCVCIIQFCHFVAERHHPKG